MLILIRQVDWSGRREDSSGRLPGPPAESEAPGAEINSSKKLRKLKLASS